MKPLRKCLSVCQFLCAHYNQCFICQVPFILNMLPCKITSTLDPSRHSSVDLPFVARILERVVAKHLKKYLIVLLSSPPPFFVSPSVLMKQRYIADTCQDRPVCLDTAEINYGTRKRLFSNLFSFLVFWSHELEET